MKTCSKCHIEKEETEFNKDKYTSSGFTTRCKLCIRSRRNALELDKSKICVICKELKSVCDYHKDSKGLYGVRAACKKCNYQKILDYRLANPVSYDSTKKKWHRSEKGKVCNNKCRNTEEFKMTLKVYRAVNRGRINAWHRNYRTSSTLRHLYAMMSGSIASSLKTSRVSKNKRKWETLAGYTVEDLKAHFDQLLSEKGLTWDGLGKVWEIDHKRPVSWFSFSSLEDPQIKECWALDNLQPLLIAENRRKLNRWSDHPDDLANGRASLEAYRAALSA